MDKAVYSRARHPARAAPKVPGARQVATVRAGVLLPHPTPTGTGQVATGDVDLGFGLIDVRHMKVANKTKDCVKKFQRGGFDP